MRRGLRHRLCAMAAGRRDGRGLVSVFSLFDGLAIRLFDGFELLGCCVTRYVGGATELCKTVMWDMRDTARRWSKFAET